MQRRCVLAGLASLPVGAIAATSTAKAASRETLVYIGTHGDAILGARLDPASGKLSYTGVVTRMPRPTWLAIDVRRNLLFATSETGNDGKSHGEVRSFAIDRATGALTPLSAVDGGGGGTTFISWEPRVDAIFSANYGDGHVAAIPVAPDGRLLPPSSIQVSAGQRGPHPKQNSAHAHGATLDPSGRYVVTPDMGFDRFYIYRYDRAKRALEPGATPHVDTPPGSGPRHITFSPDGRFLYLLTEITAEVRVYRWNGAAGTADFVQAIALNKPDYSGELGAAEIIVSDDGRFLYASNRILSSIVVFAIDKARGTLRLVQEVSTGGKRPRSFAIDPTGRWLIAGNQNSNTMATFKVDRIKGTLTPTGEVVATEQDPVAFVFLQR